MHKYKLILCLQFSKSFFECGKYLDVIIDFSVIEIALRKELGGVVLKSFYAVHRSRKKHNSSVSKSHWPLHTVVWSPTTQSFGNQNIGN